jgi:peptidoglycan/xylan/chitin deacetylase (PgdA/CDA1 family)
MIPNDLNLLFHEICNIGDTSKTGFNYKENIKYSCSINNFTQIVKFTYDNNLNINFSFDDGGISNLISSKILEEYNFKGIFFIPTFYIGKPGFLNKENIIDLYKRGHLIGSHSHTHPIPLSFLNYKSQFIEWETSKSILEEIIQDKITLAALPAGDSNFETFQILHKLGYLELHTSYPDSKYFKKYNNVVIKGRVCIMRHHDCNFVEKLVLNKFITIKLVFVFKLKEIIKKNFKFVFYFFTKNRKQ